MPRRALRSRLPRLLAGGLGLALLVGLTACTSTPDATLRVLAGTGEIDGVVVDDERRVTDGDVVEVSGTDALVEIQWSDGSFTRLATDSRFAVGGDGVRGTLDTGTAWSTVGSAGYALATDAGTVRSSAGSTFAVRCVDACDGVAATGRVTLDDGTEVVAPATFVLGSGDVVPAGWDALYSDGFALTNSARDEAAGYPSTADSWAGRAPALASVRGTFSGPSENGTQTCTGWAAECERVAANIFGASGQTSEYTLVGECKGTVPCTVVMTTRTRLADGGFNERRIPLAFDGTAYSSSITFGEGVYCVLPDGREEGRWTNSGSIRFVPTAAEMRDGVFTVTAMSAETHGELTLVDPTTDPSCAEFEYEWVNDKSADLTLRSGPAVPTSALDVTDTPVRPVAGPARPSVLSGLTQPLDAIPTLEQTGILAAGVLVLVLVLGYPAYLLSRVVSDRYDAVAGARAARLRARVERRSGVRILLLALGLVVASFITAALDPSFGAEFAVVLEDPGAIGAAVTAFAANLGSWRLVLTALVAFVLFLGVGALVVRLAGRRIAPGERMPLAFRWGSLVILLAGVVVSRVFDINPGIIFGLVAGLVIADTIPAAAKGRLAFVSAAFAIVVGVGAWIGYGVLSPLAAAAPTDLTLVIGTELLSALAIEAIATMPLAFLPILGLDGFVLRGWRLLAWAVTYAIGLALFVLLLFTLPGAWSELDPEGALRWGIGFGAFTVVAVVVFAIHKGLERRAARRAVTLEPERVAEPDGKR